MRIFKCLSAAVLAVGVVTAAGQAQTLLGPKEAPRKISEAKEIKAPRGFRAAWDDGRLNPRTGVGTAQGRASMAMVWSNTVPRYLIDPATGERVSNK